MVSSTLMRSGSSFLAQALTALAVVVAAETWSGCSWVFMDKPPSPWDGKTKPYCTTGNGAIIADHVFSALGTIGTVSVMLDKEATEDERNIALASGLVTVLVHGASAMTGESWVKDCRKINETYEAKSRGGTIAIGTESAGYWCAASPVDSTIGACNKTRERCAISQRDLVAAGSDVGPCTYREAAVCYKTETVGVVEVWCAPTVGSCTRNRTKHLDGLPEPKPFASDCADAAPAAPRPTRQFCMRISEAVRCFDTLEACNGRVNYAKKKFVKHTKCEERH